MVAEGEENEEESRAETAPIRCGAFVVLPCCGDLIPPPCWPALSLLPLPSPWGLSEKLPALLWYAVRMRALHCSTTACSGLAPSLASLALTLIVGVVGEAREDPVLLPLPLPRDAIDADRRRSLVSLAPSAHVPPTPCCEGDVTAGPPLVAVTAAALASMEAAALANSSTTVRAVR